MTTSAALAGTQSEKSQMIGTGSTVTWNDLNFWKTEKWSTIQKILESHKHHVVPDLNKVFRPFIETPLHKVKVVFVFPEPYYSVGVADGLALSTSADKRPYMFDAFIEELKRDFSVKIKRSDLKQWARRGVLLWNSRLTTLAGHARGHTGLGWEVLTREVLETVYLTNPDAVFIYVGQEVQNKYADVLPKDAKVILCNMPVPHVFSQQPDGFRGSRLFGQINGLIKGGWKSKVVWET